MKAKELVAASVTGTSLMTLFSYLVSAVEGENFSEPERLAQLAHRLVPKLSDEQTQALGWLGHYGVGSFFSMVYIKLWERRAPRSSISNDALIGAISGLLAVGIWKATFKVHPAPPALNYTKYYTQLVPAHVVFAVFAGIGYRLVKHHNKQSAAKDLTSKY